MPGRLTLPYALILTMTLAACGGGGGSAPSSTSSNAPTLRPPQTEQTQRPPPVEEAQQPPPDRQPIIQPTPPVVTPPTPDPPPQPVIQPIPPVVTPPTPDPIPDPPPDDNAGNNLIGSETLTPTTTQDPDPPPTPLPAGEASANRALRQAVIDKSFLALTGAPLSTARRADTDLLALSLDTHFIAARDTGAPEAWKLGWTGRGVKIGVLDDHLDKDGSSAGRFVRDYSHGGAVGFVTRQVAPEADFRTEQLNFGCGLAPGQQDREAAAAIANFEKSGHHIVNGSWSTSRYLTGRTCPGRDPIVPRVLLDREWNSLIEAEKGVAWVRKVALPSATDTEEVYDPNMLFVFAGGNDGITCPLGLAGCNLLAATVHSLRQASGTEAAGDRAVFVGALHDDSTLADPRLAAYAQPGGEAMKHDYLVAHDDIFERYEGSGTSFAAPRVAGAAALVRHKFPSLDGPGLKSTLLMSADDLGETGVDAVFGHGRLNILGALSPIGGLTK